MTPRDRAIAAFVELIEDSTRRHTKRLAGEIVDQLIEVVRQEIQDLMEEMRKTLETSEKLVEKPRSGSGGRCWRMSCANPVEDGKIGCVEHELFDEDGEVDGK